MNKGRAVSIAERMLNAISNLEVIGAKATTTSLQDYPIAPTKFPKRWSANTND